VTDNYLLDVAAWTAAEVARRRQTRSFLEAIGREELSVIAEFKRSSPSQGAIAADADPAEAARAYRDAGAAAISVLTSGRDFGGSLADLDAVRAAVDLPILAKDFFISTWQVTEARAHGADAILLILALVDDELARDLITAAEEHDMDVLCEAHTEDDVRRALDLACPIIGVNARDLTTLQVDPQAQRRLLRSIPPGYATVAESGVESAADARAAREAGARAVLVGTSVMRDPALVAELVGA
jgi:indole-3-glycerol phosphate synthase